MKRRALGVLFAAMCVTAVPSVAYAGLYATPSDAAQTDAAATDAGTDAAAPAEEAAPAEAAATAETAPATEAADSAAPAEAAETAPADGTGLTEVAAPVAEQADAALSDNIYDFQIKINDHVYQFPTTYEEFSSQGWVMESGHENETLNAGSYILDMPASNDTENISLAFLNLGINAIPYEQCLIGGITINGTYNINLNRTTVELAGGIQMGKSTFEDIKAAYGDPSETSETKYYTEYIYKKDNYEMVDLYVYKDDNTFKKVVIQNFVEPEGYDKGSVSDDVPDIVTAYTAPSALSDDIMAPQVEFCGDLYTLPAPVTAFLANGWTMVDVADDDYVAGGESESIKMMKNNQTAYFYLRNMTENATSVQNCMVKQLEASNLNEAVTLKTSGGLTVGSKRADIKALAEAKGYLVSEDADTLTVYKSENSRSDIYLTFRFIGDDPDTVTNLQYVSRVLQ